MVALSLLVPMASWTERPANMYAGGDQASSAGDGVDEARKTYEGTDYEELDETRLHIDSCSAD